MQSDRTASANGHPVSSPDGSGSRTKLESLQAKCRHQAVVIDALSEAVSRFRRGATALKAENVELRAEIVRLGERRRSPAGAAGRLTEGDLVELVIALDTRAPGVASDFVVLCQDSGSDAVIAARPADLVGGGGFGLNLLSERWGVERLAEGGTQVWAQLPRARGAPAGGPDGNGSAPFASGAA